MYEGTVSTGKLIATVAWGWVTVLMLSAWMIVFLDPDRWQLAGMLAATACASSALAAVVHIRLYAVRLCQLVRATRSAAEPSPQGHVERAPRPPLQPVR